jgi:hypothetical protein
MLSIDEEKTELNAQMKAEMDLYLRSKSWVEKVRSIERMNVADRIAKEAMRKALAQASALSEGTPGRSEARKT